MKPISDISLEPNGLVERVPTETIATSWIGSAFIAYNWRKSANEAGSTSGFGTGFWATCDEIPGRRVYLKPSTFKNNKTMARAAREKIASDLAFHVGVCVPPVVLTEWLSPTGHPKHLCASLVVYPRQYPWEQLDPAGPWGLFEELGRVTGLPKSAARGLVFDTWVDQVDHGNQPNHNIILGYNEGNFESAELVFLDYATSLGCYGTWGSPPQVCEAHFPAHLVEVMDIQELEGAISDVERLAPEIVQELVERIPSSFLDKEEGRNISEGLIYRQKQLRSALGHHLPGERP